MSSFWQVIYKVYSLHVQFAVLGNGLRAQPTEPGADPGGGESGVRPPKRKKKHWRDWTDNRLMLNT